MKKIREIIITVLTAGFLLSFGVLFLILPKNKTQSEDENRILASAPSFFNVLKSGFKEDFASFLADRFPARKTFVKTKAYAELASGKAENNGVIFASDGYLISRADTGEEAVKEAIGKALTAVSYTDNASVPTCFFLIGRTADIESSELPSLYDSTGDEKLRAAVYDALCGKITTYDLTETLKNAAERGEYVCYKTDHHLTEYGGEYVYRAVIDVLGGERREFAFENVSCEFLGTSYSAAGLVYKEKDTITFASFDGIENIEVKTYSRSSDGYSESDAWLYDLDALSAKDKYKAYLCGNFAKVTVRKSGEERERLLVIKDSYFNCVAPMLAANYDLDIIDPRYMRAEDVAVLCGSSDYAAVICVYGLETFVN